jgi:hypothetical protein
LATTIGNQISVRSDRYQPGTLDGDTLLIHELVHVLQQGRARAPETKARLPKAPEAREREARRAARELVTWVDVDHDLTARITPAGGPEVATAIEPEDVSSELIGRTFELTAAFTSGGTTIAAGTAVTIVAWSNADPEVSATVAAGAAPIRIPKTQIRPVRTAVGGVDRYGAGIAGQASAVTATEQQLAAWVTTAPQQRTPRARRLFDRERRRLENLLERKRRVLNRRLIQETMFNRFDAVIASEVSAANAAHALTGPAALNPNLVKSMLFEETQLGTAGQHLELAPTHPVKTRFNLGQVIDSSGMALLTLIEREQPALVTTFSLANLRSDLAAAQSELATLQAAHHRTPAQEARLTTLIGLSRQSWEGFIWGYHATGAPTGFADAVASLFAATAPARNQDYTFWIHIAVMWLFEKHRSGMTWPETIRAYNGSGARARHYRDAIVARAGAAHGVPAGTDFVPSGI